jgi:hypothetical protein
MIGESLHLMCLRRRKKRKMLALEGINTKEVFNEF